MKYCQSVIQTLNIIWVRCIQLSFRSKTRQRATRLFPTWIYCCRSVGTVSYALPFTTNVTILTFISHTFRSWIVIFHIRQPMAFLSQSSYDMPMLALLINVLFWGHHDFHISFLGRDMSGNLWHRLSGCYMVDMMISSNIMKSPSPKYYMPFWDMTIYSDFLHWWDNDKTFH